MEINCDAKELSQTPKTYVRVELTEGSERKFHTEEGVETLTVGVGKPFKDITRRNFTIIYRLIISIAKQHKIKKLAVPFNPAIFPLLQDIKDTELAETLAVAVKMANYEYTNYKTPASNGSFSVEEVLVCIDPSKFSASTSKELRDALINGRLIATEINTCRDECNTPGSDMTPALLAKKAKEAVKGTKATVTVLNKKELEKLGMCGVLGIGRGSAHEPKFIIVEYWGAETKTNASKKEQPIVLVGKGVTFDTGGLNIKTGNNMYEMHMDMSGGSVAIHTVALAAKLRLKVNAVALVPAVENSTGSDAIRPGDIIKSLSGKTIEMLDTDAEGRVILADGITYAKKYNPKSLVDIATLTGAALVALGTEAAAFMTNEKNMSIAKHMELAETSGDYIWPLPLWEEYDTMVKGGFADIPNMPTTGNTRYGGAIAGGKFLEVFAKELDCQWTHIDIAPTMVSAHGQCLAKGATGACIRLLLAIIKQHTKA